MLRHLPQPLCTKALHHRPRALQARFDISMRCARPHPCFWRSRIRGLDASGSHSRARDGRECDAVGITLERVSRALLYLRRWFGSYASYSVCRICAGINMAWTESPACSLRLKLAALRSRRGLEPRPSGSSTMSSATLGHASGSAEGCAHAPSCLGEAFRGSRYDNLAIEFVMLVVLPQQKFFL